MKKTGLVLLLLALSGAVIAQDYPTAAEEIEYQMAKARAEKAKQDKIVAEQRRKEAEEAAKKAADEAEEAKKKAEEARKKQEEEQKAEEEREKAIKDLVNQQGKVLPPEQGGPVVIPPHLAPYVRTLLESRDYLKSEISKLEKQNDILLRQNVSMQKSISR